MLSFVYYFASPSDSGVLPGQGSGSDPLRIGDGDIDNILIILWWVFSLLYKPLCWISSLLRALSWNITVRNNRVNFSFVDSTVILTYLSMVCLRHVRRLSVATLGIPVCRIHVLRDQGRLYPYVYRRDKCLYMRASIWVLKAQQWFKLQVKACLCLKASYFTARNLFFLEEIRI
jgi:hypothetical protein